MTNLIIGIFGYNNYAEVLSGRRVLVPLMIIQLSLEVPCRETDENRTRRVKHILPNKSSY